MKILIVEDEEMIREGVSDYLTDCGYETIEASGRSGSSGAIF